MSPRRVAELRDAIGKLKKNESLTPYQRQRTRKSLYRQLRNKAYEESWESQLEIKKQIADEERRRDKEKVEAFREFIAEEKVRQQAQAAQKKTEEQRVLDMNLTLATARAPLALPRAVEPGDIFNARHPTFAAKADKSFLATQIRLAEERRQREKAEDKLHGARAKDLADEWKAERRSALQEKRDQQRKIREEYEAQIAQKKREQEHYKKTLTNGGALLFSGDDSAKQEEEDRRMVLEKSRATQLVNKNVATARAVEVERETLERGRQLVESQKEFQHHERMLRAQQEKQHNAVKERLRSAWEEQISERRRRQWVEREADRQWKEHNYLKNESSDEEEDD